MSNKGTITVLGHQIEWECDVKLDELQDNHIQQISNDLLEVTEGEMPVIGGEGTITWRIVNPEADRWREVADMLYSALIGTKTDDDYQTAVDKYRELCK